MYYGIKHFNICVGQFTVYSSKWHLTVFFLCFVGNKIAWQQFWHNWILYKQLVTMFNLACMHALIHFSLAFDFLNQDLSRVFLNVVAIGFAPVLTAQLTSTLWSPIQIPMQWPKNILLQKWPINSWSWTERIPAENKLGLW